MWRISHSSAEIIGPFVAWAARVVCLTWLLPWTSHRLSHVQRSFKSQLTRKVPSISQRVRKVNALKVNLFVFIPGWSGWLHVQDPNEKLEEDNDGIESVAGEDLDPVSTPKSPRHSSTFAGREIETSPTEAKNRNRGLSSWMLTGRLA